MNLIEQELKRREKLEKKQQLEIITRKKRKGHKLNLKVKMPKRRKKKNALDLGLFRNAWR